MTKEQLDKQVEEQLINVANIITQNFVSQDEVRVLEAGCGSYTELKLPSYYKLIGIDISQQQLERNKILSEKICGDIQTYPLQAQSYDMVISWYVLEHVKQPLKALQNFNDALKKNGLIVLALPNIWSVKGIVTKFTPTFVHVLFYRVVGKEKSRGKDDMGPFKTYLKPSISPANIKKYALENNLSVEYFGYSEEFLAVYLKKKTALASLVQVCFTIFGGLLRIVSLGKITLGNTDFIIVLKKKI